jgi:hypothetical protein
MVMLLLLLNAFGAGYKQNGDYMTFIEPSVTWLGSQI